MSTLPTVRGQFPSLVDRERLRQLCAIWDSKHENITGFDLEKLSDADRWLWHAYNYAFRRVALQTRDDALPTDPGRKWLSHELAARAEPFWVRELGRSAPDLPMPRRQMPTPEEIAYVEECCRKVRGNLRLFIDNTSKPFKGLPK